MAEALVEQDNFTNLNVTGNDTSFLAEQVSKHATYMLLTII